MRHYDTLRRDRVCLFIKYELISLEWLVKVSVVGGQLWLWILSGELINLCGPHDTLPLSLMEILQRYSNSKFYHDSLALRNEWNKVDPFRIPTSRHIPTDNRCKNQNSVQNSCQQMCFFQRRSFFEGELNAHEIDL